MDPAFKGVNTSSCIPANMAKAALAADLSLLIVSGRGTESSIENLPYQYISTIVLRLMSRGTSMSKRHLLTGKKRIQAECVLLYFHSSLTALLLAIFWFNPH
jgi:hypothetical protein